MDGLPSPKLMVTFPVGVPAPGAAGATVVVMVTGWPTVEGSGVDVTVVVVADWLTVCVSVSEDPAKLLLPP